MKHYKAYLFDMDGTLVDSECLKGQALADACAEFGGKVEPDVYKTVMGDSWDVVTEHFFRTALVTPAIDIFNQKFRTIYRQLLENNVSLTNGADGYITYLKSINRKLGLVSSAAAWIVEQTLKQLSMEDAFDIVITQEDVTRHKPYPDAYNLALKQLHVKPEEALVFEDSNAGLNAASQAGCKTIAVEHHFNGSNDMSLAVKKIRSFKEMMTGSSPN